MAISHAGFDRDPGVFRLSLMTGIAGGITGVDRLGWPALLTALAAFLGLALMLGSEFHNLSGIE